MLRSALFIVFLALVLSAPLVGAQGVPGGPVPGLHPPSQGPRHPEGSPGQPPGPQQPPAWLPPDVLHAPYNGPSTRLPPGVNIPVPRNQEEARAIEAQYRPQLEQAAAQARAGDQIARQMSQRVARGDRSPPTPAETQAVAGQYSPNRPAPARPPRPRSQGPAEHVLNLLGFRDVAATPEAEPDAVPDADPSAQTALNACAVYPLFWEGFDEQWQEDIFYAQSYHFCNYIELYRIDRMEVSQHLYRCSWYWVYFNYCHLPQYRGSFYPYCEQYGAHSFQICGPQVWYPENIGAGYFTRVWANLTTTEGLFGTTSRDSVNIGYACDLHRYFDMCS
jgi:hypothetical protein